MSARLRAAVIGLGQVGWRFDQEAGRRSVWSHAGAYTALGEAFELAGAADPSAEARRDFAAAHPGVPAFAEIATMMRETAPEIVSICAPNAAHRAALDAVLAAGRPRAVWCEKPLAVSLADGKAMVAACDAVRALLVVSHVRRWSPLWQTLKRRIDGNEIGRLRSLRIAMPNRLWTIGSHAADLLLWLGGPAVAVAALPIPALEEAGEPAVDAIVTFESGAAGILQVTGEKSGLIVEAEAIGTDGRLCLREDCGTIAAETFRPSTRYAGYRELAAGGTEAIAQDDQFSPFVAIAREIAGLCAGDLAAPTCSGRDALATQALLDRLAAAAAPLHRSMASA